MSMCFSGACGAVSTATHWSVRSTSAFVPDSVGCCALKGNSLPERLCNAAESSITPAVAKESVPTNYPLHTAPQAPIGELGESGIRDGMFSPV